MGDNGAYGAPLNIMVSVLAENKAAACVLDALNESVGRMMAVLGKELPDPRWAEPPGVKEFRTIFDAVREQATTAAVGPDAHASTLGPVGGSRSWEPRGMTGMGIELGSARRLLDSSVR
ncbi:hypothetical protein DIPPA_04816 [Diplonema papillatum]|nr:hypothetical protein DIPPA_04816 [Diplonema papillatum]